MIIESPVPQIEPAPGCALCPRLVDVRAKHQAAQPDWWNAPVPAYGDAGAWLAVVGLAPGKTGANRTGRPFTGDASGELLWTAMEAFGFDREGPLGAVILNAVKCVPPGNKPTPEEIRTCRPFLKNALDALPNLRVIIALGGVAHQSVVKANGEKLPKRRFAHRAVHQLLNGRVLIDSFHPSQLNQNTGRITQEMLDDVFALADQMSAAKRP